MSGWKKRLKQNPFLNVEYNLNRCHNITSIEYDLLLAQQQNRCAICNGNPRKECNAKQARFWVDHDHDTDQIRGLLCHGCNSGLGWFKDNITSLQNAIDYLNGSNKSEELNFLNQQARFRKTRKQLGIKPHHNELISYPDCMKIRKILYNK